MSLVELNQADAEDLRISAYEKILVASRRGKVTATAFITNMVQRGQVFIPMHYAVANELTFPAVDPSAGVHGLCGLPAQLRLSAYGTCALKAEIKASTDGPELGGLRSRLQSLAAVEPIKA